MAVLAVCPPQRPAAAAAWPARPAPAAAFLPASPPTPHPCRGRSARPARRRWWPGGGGHSVHGNNVIIVSQASQSITKEVVAGRRGWGVQLTWWCRWWWRSGEREGARARQAGCRGLMALLQIGGLGGQAAAEGEPRTAGAAQVHGAGALNASLVGVLHAPCTLPYPPWGTARAAPARAPRVWAAAVLTHTPLEAAAGPTP